MADVPDLDTLGELYPGFSQDRDALKRAIPNFSDVWRKAFAEVRRTDEFYQRKTDDAARETMRMLMEALGRR
jgi:hypothetical protein